MSREQLAALVHPGQFGSSGASRPAPMGGGNGSMGIMGAAPSPLETAAQENSEQASYESAITPSKSAAFDVQQGQTQAFTSRDEAGNPTTVGQYYNYGDKRGPGLAKDITIQGVNEGGKDYLPQSERDKIIQSGLGASTRGGDALENMNVPPSDRAMQRMAKRTGKFGY